MVQKNNIQLEQIVHLNHIYKFENNEELKHLEKNYITYPYKTYNKKLQNISVNMYISMLDEVRDVAKKVVQLCQNENYRYRDSRAGHRPYT